MLNAAEKTEIRSMVLDMVDRWQEEGYWPTHDEPRWFDVAWYGHLVGGVYQMPPRWGMCEKRDGEPTFYQKRGVMHQATVIVSRIEESGQPYVLIHYFGGTGYVGIIELAERYLVDTMTWQRKKDPLLRRK